MSKKVKDARVQVILECTEQKATGIPGTSRYVTTKNKKNTPERLELRKYNPILKRVTVHKEIKQLLDMAKKAVASLHLTGREYTKVIKMKKSEKTGAYYFDEAVVPNDMVQEYIAKK